MVLGDRRVPETALGELHGIKGLPGMVGAAADTLRKAWRAGVDLQARAGEHPRLQTDTHEEATAGIVDAIAFDAEGAPQVVIDWKSDLDPSPETLEHYRAQVRAYLDATGAKRGLVVCMAPGILQLIVQND